MEAYKDSIIQTNWVIAGGFKWALNALFEVKTQLDQKYVHESRQFYTRSKILILSFVSHQIDARFPTAAIWWDTFVFLKWKSDLWSSAVKKNKTKKTESTSWKETVSVKAWQKLANYGTRIKKLTVSSRGQVIVLNKQK